MAGMIIYMLLVNPLLVLSQYSNDKNMAVLLNSQLMENFLMHIAICGGFMLIMANGYNEDEFTGNLIESSDDGANTRGNARGPSSS